MKNSKIVKRALCLAVVIVPIAFITMSNTSSKSSGYAIKAADICDCFSPSSAAKTSITFNNQVPGDLPAFTFQSQANCFAWQEFISLNWPTNPSSGFGEPNDMQFVQWETYIPREVLFQQDGSKPPAWGTLVSDEYSSLFKSQKLLLNKTRTKLLTFNSKIDTDSTDGVDVTFTPDQAAPFGKPSWLGAQNGTNVWYEIMLNKDYYDFVVSNGYYNAKNQHTAAAAGTPMVFPSGVYNGATGAIELKAAWMEVTNPQSPQWKRFKLSKATVLDADTKKLRNTVVALVGMHILHKTENQPTWVWATFEQIDNVPDASIAKSGYGYNFYSDQCQNRNVSIKTASGDSTVVVTCTANTSPPYYLTQAKAVPVQVTRTNPIDTKDAAPVNTLMQNNIRKFYPNSVWQYYQLVDVIWSKSYQPDPTKPIQSPRNLNNSSMTSGDKIVANTTMETYVQSSDNCLSCHTYSTIAAYPQDSINNNVFGDFSFAISAAKYPATVSKQKKIMKTKKKTVKS